MSPTDLARAATQFREMHRRGALLLPNAWDAASARIFEEAGFPAVATTSAGIAWARGLPDGERMTRDAMAREIASIAAAVRCPVTADVEAGYGPAPSDAAATVDAVIDAGAIGINLEDSRSTPGDEPLFRTEEHAARVAAAREAGARRNVPIVINARTDPFLLNLGADVEERVAMSIERGRAYLNAGADVVFVPGLVDPDVVRRVASGIGGPISLLYRPGGPSAQVLFEAGACRVSLGSGAMLATLGALRAIAQELRRTSQFPPAGFSALTYAEAQKLFEP